MKNFFTIFSLATLLFACQQQPAAPAVVAPAFDEAAETAALMKVIEGETAAFMTKVFEESMKFYSSAPDISHTVFGNGDLFYRSLGREQMEANMKAFWAANPNYEVGQTTRSNWIWRINPDLAWCSFEQVSSTGNKSLEQRVFVKENGQWKIHTVLVGQTGGPANLK